MRMIAGPVHEGQVMFSWRAIFKPQSGHQTSSSRRAMKMDCQTPRCLWGLQCRHSASVSRVGLKAQGASSFHLANWSIPSSQSRWKKLRCRSAVKTAETGWRGRMFPLQPTHFIMAARGLGVSWISGECYPGRLIVLKAVNEGVSSDVLEGLTGPRGSKTNCQAVRAVQR